MMRIISFCFAAVVLSTAFVSAMAATDPGSVGGPTETAESRLTAHYAACPDLVASLHVFFARDYDDAADDFAVANCDDPVAATVGAWQALAEWRDGRPGDAIDTARRALARDPGCGLAHFALAQASNPQLKRHARADADTAWTHLLEAVRHDPGLPDAWTMVWVEAFKRGDLALQREALRTVDERRFYGPGLVAMWQWTLDCLPPNALLLVNGDNDTFPLLMLQSARAQRPDVAVVNIVLLELPVYAQRVADLHDLPLPATDRAPKGYRRHGDVGSGSIISHWASAHQSGSLDRPLHVALTVTKSDLPAVIRDHMVIMGATYAHDPRSPAGEIGIDVDTLQRNMARLDVNAATRSYENLHHVSPVTASAAHLVDNLVNLTERLCHELATLWRDDEAAAALGLMRRIIEQGDLEKRHGATLRDFEKLLRDLESLE